MWKKSFEKYLGRALRLKPPRGLGRQLLSVLVTSCAALGICTVAAPHYDEAAYAFGSQQMPLWLGEAQTLSPARIIHNTYVQIDGITEHRALRQEVVRGLGLVREEQWLFGLLGSGGTFIAVKADKHKYAPTMQLRVQGRAVDPKYAAHYASLLRQYDQIFARQAMGTGRAARVIEVDVRPGEGRTPYCAMTAAVLICVAVALRAALRLVALLRRAATA